MFTNFAILALPSFYIYSVSVFGLFCFASRLLPPLFFCNKTLYTPAKIPGCLSFHLRLPYRPYSSSCTVTLPKAGTTPTVTTQCQHSAGWKDHSSWSRVVRPPSGNAPLLPQPGSQTGTSESKTQTTSFTQQQRTLNIQCSLITCRQQLHISEQFLLPTYQSPVAWCTQSRGRWWHLDPKLTEEHLGRIGL